MPRVSVVMPTYNQADYIEESINSILQQTFEDYEIVVVNDGSTDPTEKVLEPYMERIRYFARSRAGQAAARNFGIAMCEGDLIAFLDSDDLWSPDKLEKQVRHMDLNPEVGMTHADYIRIDECGRRLGLSTHTGTEPSLSLHDLVCRNNTIGLLTATVRKSWLEQVGGFDAGLDLGEDPDLWIRLAYNGCQFSYVDEVLGLWRRHRASISRSSVDLCRSHIQIFEKLLRNLGSGEADEEIRILAERRVLTEKTSLCREQLRRGERTIARDLALDLIREGHASPRTLVLLIESVLPFDAHLRSVLGRDGR